MGRRRFLGHIDPTIHVNQKSTAALSEEFVTQNQLTTNNYITQAELDNHATSHLHGSQFQSGSVYITEPGSALHLIGTDQNGDVRTFRLGITGSLVHLIPTGSS
jgi:hypothetical protein